MSLYSVFLKTTTLHETENILYIVKEDAIGKIENILVKDVQSYDINEFEMLYISNIKKWHGKLYKTNEYQTDPNMIWDF